MKVGPFDVPGYHVGDCRALLAQVPDESIHCCVTSPPYWGLRDYGVDGQLGLEQTPDEYVDAMAAVFRDVRRVLRKDGTCWVNLGDSYAANVKGSGGAADPKRQIKGVANFQAMEPWKCRHGLKPKDIVGIPWRVAFALQADGWYLRSDIIWSKPNPMPESVTDRPTKAHEYLFLLAKSDAYYYDAEAIREAALQPVGDAHSTGQGKRERADPGMGRYQTDLRSSILGSNQGSPWRNKRSVWHIATEPTPDAHFATFPRKLVEPCVLAGCPAGGIVLDPFGGSGTTGRVAEDTGRNWLLFDLNPAYGQIAKRKTAQMGLLIRAAETP